MFYIGLNPRYQSFSWLPKGINIMLSAAGYWGGDGWRYTHRYPKQTGSRWLDSGGFTMLNKFGDYPFTAEQYAHLVAWLKPHYYAVMDYPCEPNISRSLSLMDNRKRIEKTVENALELSKYEMHLDDKLVPVIQGYSIEEYLYCINLYKASNMMRRYMAVGSMCRRISNEELHKLIPGIYYAAKDAGCNRLHFFGLKLSKNLIDMEDYIYSRDSAVALDSYCSSIRKTMNGRRWPKGQREKKIVFMSFLNRLTDLGLNWSSGEKDQLSMGLEGI